jgi:surfactin synthase thioesterase subunit
MFALRGSLRSLLALTDVLECNGSMTQMSSVNRDSGLWIRKYHRSVPEATRLVCLPHAGGSASFYFPVSRALAPSVEVVAVQYPGRQDRRGESCVDDLPTLVRLVLGELDGWLDRPIALFGHSMGATIAFELARLLEHERGIAVTWLFASGRRAPSRPRAERVHLETDEGLVAELRQLSGTDGSLLDDGELLRMVLPATRADYRAVELYEYEPGPMLSCPVTVFVGDDDPKVTLDEAGAWREHTTGPFDLNVFNGGHFFITAHQHEVLTIIARQLRSGTVG